MYSVGSNRKRSLANSSADRAKTCSSVTSGTNQQSPPLASKPPTLKAALKIERRRLKSEKVAAQEKAVIDHAELMAQIRNQPGYGFVDQHLVVPVEGAGDIGQLPSWQQRSRGSRIMSAKRPIDKIRLGGLQKCAVCKTVVTLYFHLLQQVPMCNKCCSGKSFALVAKTTAAAQYCVPETVLKTVLGLRIWRPGMLHKRAMVVYLEKDMQRAAEAFWTSQAQKAAAKAHTEWLRRKGASSAAPVAKTARQQMEVEVQRRAKKALEAFEKRKLETVGAAAGTVVPSKRLSAMPTFGSKAGSTPLDHRSALVDYDPSKTTSVAVVVGDALRPAASSWWGLKALKRPEPVVPISERTRAKNIMAETSSMETDVCDDVDGVMYVGSSCLKLESRPSKMRKNAKALYEKNTGKTKQN